jgi:hypothetical protein
MLVIGVNTTRWRHKHGEVSTAQIDRVAKLLSAATPQQLRLVVVHQPAAVAHAEEHANLLRGHDAALGAWSAAGADLVLGGHIHLSYTLAVHGLPGDCGAPGRYRHFVAHSPRSAQLGEYPALGRGSRTWRSGAGRGRKGGVLPDRAVGLCAPRSGLYPHLSHPVLPERA